MVTMNENPVKLGTFDPLKFRGGFAQLPTCTKLVGGEPLIDVA